VGGLKRRKGGGKTANPIKGGGWGGTNFFGMKVQVSKGGGFVARHEERRDREGKKNGEGARDETERNFRLPWGGADWGERNSA